MASTTMTIRIDDDTKVKLDRLAGETRRSRSFLAADALAGYVARELEIIDGIKQGLADVEAGRVVPHDEVMAKADAIVEAAKRKQAKAA